MFNIKTFCRKVVIDIQRWKDPCRYCLVKATCDDNKECDMKFDFVEYFMDQQTKAFIDEFDKELAISLKYKGKNNDSISKTPKTK